VVFSVDSPKISNFEWLEREGLELWWLENGVDLYSGRANGAGGHGRVFIPLPPI